MVMASLPPASSPSCNATNHRANNPQDPCLFSPPTDSPILFSSFSIAVVEEHEPISVYRGGMLVSGV
ncbi:hypothetical protein LXL04_037870 [Taraxacum kok-saghyz]